MQDIARSLCKTSKIDLAIQSVTKKQVVQHWYNILDKQLKDIVEREALKLGVSPILRYVFETSKRIEINLLEERATTGFLIKIFKLVEKLKARKESLPSYTSDSQPKCFNCDDHKHLKAYCSQLKEKALGADSYGSKCRKKGHGPKKYWIIYLKLKLNAAKKMVEFKSGQGQATTKNLFRGEEKSLKAKVAKLKAKMATMSGTIEARGASSKERKMTPNCYTEKYDHMLHSIAVARELREGQVFKHMLI